MPKSERSVIVLEDNENGRLHAAWSRSGKRLLLTATTPTYEQVMQVELRPDQVKELIEFLSETVDVRPTER
jgi:hypothetical protein